MRSLKKHDPIKSENWNWIDMFEHWILGLGCILICLQNLMGRCHLSLFCGITLILYLNWQRNICSCHPLNQPCNYSNREINLRCSLIVAIMFVTVNLFVIFDRFTLTNWWMSEQMWECIICINEFLIKR